jgi:hypothetical protein
MSCPTEERGQQFGHLAEAPRSGVILSTNMLAADEGDSARALRSRSGMTAFGHYPFAELLSAPPTTQPNLSQYSFIWPWAMGVCWRG